jgi:hypothetical protein
VQVTTTTPHKQCVVSLWLPFLQRDYDATIRGRSQFTCARLWFTRQREETCQQPVQCDDNCTSVRTECRKVVINNILRSISYRSTNSEFGPGANLGILFPPETLPNRTSSFLAYYAFTLPSTGANTSCKKRPYESKTYRVLESWKWPNCAIHNTSAYSSLSLELV